MIEKEMCKGKVTLLGHNSPSAYIFTYFLFHIFESDPVNAKINLYKATFQFALAHYLDYPNRFGEMKCTKLQCPN